ncbi:beta strand repeat-containing protein [Paraburkholderia sacchari]|uniref:Filamentous hemagglutinin N-terminal domain-containing protein n=1 Tax=Paraburkholderia sacchari TaxID=159450 RepID=A0A8T6Z8M9_9BURK|nr:filamentous hemagglutinin N-terminal domain-containing protein [Paraburkholderia sacchari]NLP60953.1 filamentous hemagglutinin N-terminal domain-containing protein [Paraburkholderia sacchari]
MPAMLTAALGYANSVGAVEGGVVAAGSGTIATQGAKTTINQSSDRMVVNWNNFNIARDQTVAFNQPSATSAVLNRVTTAAPTQIDGTLTANGRVFVVNPSGVMFGKTSQVNVGSLVASTLNVDSQKFMDGGEPVTGIMNLSANGGQGVVSNDGQITAREAVVLLGAQATNQGTIRAKDVTLGAADGVAMQMSGSGFRVMLGREAQNALAANSGTITASGGNVQLNAAATGAMLATVVRNSGTLEATRATTGEGGSIVLGSQLDGNVSAGGRINAATDITIGSTPVKYPPFLSPFNADTAPSGGEYGSAGHNVTIEKGANLTTSQGTISIGSAGGNVVSNGRVNSGGDVKIGAGGTGSVTVNEAVNGNSVAVQGTGVDINSWMTASKGDLSIKADGAGIGDLNQNANLEATKGSVNLTGTNVTQKKGVSTYAGDGMNIGASGTIQAARLNAVGDVQLGAAGPIAINDAITGRGVFMQGTGVNINSSITASTGDVSVKADALGQGDLNQNASVTASKGSVNLMGTNILQKKGYVTYAGNGVNIGATGTLQAARLNAVGDVQLGAVGSIAVNDAITARSVAMQGTGVDLNSSITASKGDVSIKANNLGQGDLNQNWSVTASVGSVNLTGTNISQKTGYVTYAGDGVNIGATNALQVARVNAVGDVQLGAAGPIAVNDAVNGRSVAMQGTGIDVNSSITATKGDVSIKADGLGQGDLNQNASVTASLGSVNLTGTNVAQKKGYVTYAGTDVNIGAANTLQVARVNALGDALFGAAGAIAVNDAITARGVAMQGTGVDVNSSIVASTGDVAIRSDSFGSGNLNQNANVTATKGSVNLIGTNIVQKKAVLTTAGNAVSIGATGTLQAARVSAGGDVKIGTLGDGDLAITGDVTGANVAMQGTGVEITAPITATKGDVSIQAFNTKLGDLTQFANVTATKGSVNLIGGNVIQTSGVSTVAGQDVSIAAAGEVRAQRVSAGGDVLLAAVGENALTTNAEVRGGSVTMMGSGVNINGNVTATTGDVQVQADGALPGSLKQYANVTATKGSVYLTGSNVVQDVGVSTTAGQDVKIGTSGTLQAGLLSGKTVSVEGDSVFLLRDVNADGDIVAHATNRVCTAADAACKTGTKGVFQLGNITSRNGGVLLAVDPGVSIDPRTGIPTIAYTGMIGQYPTTQTRAATDIALRAVAVVAGNNTAGKSITVEAAAPTYLGTLKAPTITLPTPITVSAQ